MCPGPPTKEPVLWDTVNLVCLWATTERV
uniref:Uncharacterized protein n=1 Tax=Anguilla anguilla TaxID=7936 RepID=A0A0E9SP23_ANGAN